jgi:hypothetical protein
MSGTSLAVGSTVPSDEVWNASMIFRISIVKRSGRTMSR